MTGPGDHGATRRPQRTRDRVVAIVGGVAVLLAVAGLAIVEARTGPFEHPARAPDRPVSLTGTIEATSGSPASAGQDACVAGPPLCQPPTIQADLRATGLPALGPPLVYVGFLVGEDRVLPLGPFEPHDGDHVLATEREGDADGLDTFVVALSQDPAASRPSPFVVHQVGLVIDDGTSEVDLGFPANLGPIDGRVSVAQIGAFEVSTTADVEIRGLPTEPGWTYRAWFVDETGSETWLGELAPEGAGILGLDVRIERVTLSDQARFLITLEPTDRDPIGGPGGFPVVDVRL